VRRQETTIVSGIEGKRNAYRILMRRPEGKRPLEVIDIGRKIIFKESLER
jgi:hypothetical protein